MNAYTSFDETVYYITIPSDQAQLALRILSDMMFFAKFTTQSLEKELEVIMEEFRRGKDNPQSLLFESLFSQAYSQHPYRHPIIGYQPTIQAITLKEIEDFYRDWYHPENMTLVCVGDF